MQNGRSVVATIITRLLSQHLCCFNIIIFSDLLCRLKQNTVKLKDNDHSHHDKITVYVRLLSLFKDDLLRLQTLKMKSKNGGRFYCYSELVVTSGLTVCFEYQVKISDQYSSGICLIRKNV